MPKELEINDRRRQLNVPGCSIRLSSDACFDVRICLN